MKCVNESNECEGRVEWQGEDNCESGPQPSDVFYDGPGFLCEKHSKEYWDGKMVESYAPCEHGFTAGWGCAICQQSEMDEFEATRAEANERPIEIGAVTKRWLELWSASAAAAKKAESEVERTRLFELAMWDRESIGLEIEERLACIRHCIETRQDPRYHARLVGFSNKLVDAFYDLGCAVLFDGPVEERADAPTQPKGCEWSRSEMAA